MTIRALSFLALVFTALSLVPYAAHLFALPNKIGMTQEQYFTAQSIYSGWSLMAFILVPALLLNVAFAGSLYGHGRAFGFAAAACVLMLATLAIFFVWTYPANVATENWTSVPANWMQLRLRWEYSHAVNALLMIVVFSLVALASIAPRR
jgi:hypothetical protein